MAKCKADLVYSHTRVLPCGFGESGLGGYSCTHAVFTDMAHSFVQSTYAVFDTAGTFCQSGTAYGGIGMRGAREADVGSGVDVTGGSKTEGLGHALFVVDREWIVTTVVAELVQDV